MPERKSTITWEKVLDHGELPDGRVKPVSCHRLTICMTHWQGEYHALDNKCPHQGGPLGEGSIENGLLRCPWHGWDFDPATVHAVEAPVWGEIGVTARALREALGKHQPAALQGEDLARRWSIWRAEKESREQDDRGRGLNSAAIFAAMNRQVPEDAIIAVDVGNNTYSFGRYFECRRQAVLMSGYLGSIGFALPAAMGAWAATQEDDPRFHARPVVSISGDGGFGQYMGELLHNGELGKISKEQRSGNWDVWQTSLHNPNFAEYARLCGALGIRVEKKEELDTALKTALAHDGPSLVEIMSDAELV